MSESASAAVRFAEEEYDANELPMPAKYPSTPVSIEVAMTRPNEGCICRIVSIAVCVSVLAMTFARCGIKFYTCELVRISARFPAKKPYPSPVHKSPSTRLCYIPQHPPAMTSRPRPRSLLPTPTPLPIPIQPTPAHLEFLTIYNPALGPTDETLEKQIVFYTSERQKEGNQRLREVGLAQGIVEFARYIEPTSMCFRRLIPWTEGFQRQRTYRRF